MAHCCKVAIHMDARFICKQAHVVSNLGLLEMILVDQGSPNSAKVTAHMSCTMNEDMATALALGCGNSACILHSFLDSSMCIGACQFPAGQIRPPPHSP